MSGTGSPFVIGRVSTSASPNPQPTMPSLSYDQPQIRAYAVTYAGPAFELLGIETCETSKSDGADAGTFTLTMPDIINAQAATTITKNDVIAIYGARPSSDGSGYASTPGPTTPIGQLSTLWGSSLLLDLLRSSGTCIMIGLVDRIVESSSSDGVATLSISGRDMTKIFMQYDCGYWNVPTKAAANFSPGKVSPSLSQRQAAASSAYILSQTLIKVSNFLITRSNSGTQLLENFLDVAVARNLAALSPSALNGVSAQAQAVLAQWGFPWRNWIDFNSDENSYAYFDPDFKHYNGPNEPGLSYSIQAGSAWANLQELRNEPFNRLFVTEDGYLVFDDANTAYFGRPADVVIGPDQIRSFETQISDDDTATFITVLCAQPLGQGNINSLQNTNPLISTLAGYGFASFVNGTAQANPVGVDPAVQRYGLRDRTLISNYDSGINTADVQTDFQFLLNMLNNSLRAHIVVKGNPYYRVGQRMKVIYGHQRPETQNSTWYIDSVTHHMEFGSEWTCEMDLAYPSGWTELSQ